MSFTYYIVSAYQREVGKYSTEALAEEMKERFLSTKPVFGNVEGANRLITESEIKICKVSFDVDVHMFPEVGDDPEYKRMRQAKVAAEIAKLEDRLKMLRETKV